MKNQSEQNLNCVQCYLVALMLLCSLVSGNLGSVLGTLISLYPGGLASHKLKPSAGPESQSCPEISGLINEEKDVSLHHKTPVPRVG